MGFLRKVVALKIWLYREHRVALDERRLDEHLHRQHVGRMGDAPEQLVDRVATDGLRVNVDRGQRRMKIGEQLRFFAELKNVTGSEADARINRWLTKLQLQDWKDKRTKDLSKGMQQKVQFITSVIHEPDLLILDEPFSGLDPVNVDLMKETILELKGENKTIILSTHQMEIAEKLCDDVCMINRSRKVFDGGLREIRRSFALNAVAVRLEGADGFPNDPELIVSVREVGDEFEVLLNPGTSPQTLLKRLVDSEVIITKFELIEPSLHDIFVQKVREAA